MIKAINVWTVPQDVTFPEMFETLSAHGFEAVELNIDEVGASAHSLTLDMTQEELMDIHALSRKHSVAICSICTALHGDTLGCADEAENERGKEIIRTQLRFARVLGAGNALVALGGFSETQSLAAAYARAHDVLRSMKSEIEGQPVTVGIENANEFFTSPFDLKRFIDELDIKNVGAYLDLGNVLFFMYMFPEHWVEVLGNCIVNVHVKDYLKLRWSEGVFVPLLTGNVPFERAIPALKKVGYDGPLVAELPGMMQKTPDFLYSVTKQALDIFCAY